MKWRVLDLFSGIGGFSLGLERAGMKPIAFCENDKFCRRVLRKHWPEVPILGDITKETFEGIKAEVIVGGFPCQDISLAGKRAGLAGARSGLYRELMRALRVVRPKCAIVENVSALLSDGMGTILGDMAESGFDTEWDCVPASAIGAPHRRDRVWIVAHDAPNVEGVGCGEGGPWRFPDSFAGVRDETRRNAADPRGARLAFREGLTRDAQKKLSPAERDAFENVGQSIWPDEPALSGVDDGVPDWVDRVKVTGNTVLPQIPEIIGKTLMRSSK